MRRGCMVGATIAGILLILALLAYFTDTLGRKIESPVNQRYVSSQVGGTDVTLVAHPNKVIYCGVLHDRATLSQCAYYEEIWSKLDVGSGGVHVPPSIERGETETISFAISRNQISAPLSDALGAKPNTEVKLKIGRLMAAQLQGDGFKIDPAGLQQRDLFLGDSTRWDWQVTPLKAPKYRLVLTAYVIVRSADGGEKQSLLKALELPLPVTVTWGQRVGDFMDDSIAWLTKGTNWIKALTAFLLALGALFAVVRRGKKPVQG